MSGGLPNLFLPGAQKSATTTAVDLLGSHREVYTSARKEPHFFSIDRKFEQGERYYRQCYRGWRGERYVLDGSQCYLPLPPVPERIVRLLGTDLKFIIVLRHPVDRAASAFAHMRIHRGGEMVRAIRDIVPPNLGSLSLDDLLVWEAAEVRRRLACGDIIGRHDTWTEYLFPFNYFQVSAYAWQIENYLKHFPRERFLFLTFEEVTRDQDGVKRKCAAFLDLDSAGFGTKPLRQRRETLQYKLPALQSLQYLRGPLRCIVPEPIAHRLRQFERRYLVEVPNMKFDDGTCRVLSRLYAPEIDRVAELTGLDLEWGNGQRKRVVATKSVSVGLDSTP